MRKFVLALAVLLGSFAALVAPADIASAKPVKQVVTGPFTGTGVFDFSDPSCSFAHQEFDATYTAKTGGSGSFQLVGCTELGTATAFPFSGSATLTEPDGSVLTGTVSGTVGPQTGALNFTLSLTGAAGSTTIVRLTGVWTSTAQPGVPGPVTGTLSGK